MSVSGYFETERSVSRKKMIEVDTGTEVFLLGQLTYHRVKLPPLLQLSSDNIKSAMPTASSNLDRAKDLSLADE